MPLLDAPGEGSEGASESAASTTPTAAPAAAAMGQRRAAGLAVVPRGVTTGSVTEGVGGGTKLGTLAAVGRGVLTRTAPSRTLVGGLSPSRPEAFAGLPASLSGGESSALPAPRPGELEAGARAGGTGEPGRPAAGGVGAPSASPWPG
ncbi:MAG TPA: hypothetical protein VFS00_28510, partial [Polyangiaceae bacterium]|nr:hypothetical protein [Polyangiaceae bacterium]